MSGNAPQNPICPNGHQQPVAATRFCIYCGSAVVPAQRQQTGPAVGAVPQPPVQNNAPPQGQPQFRPNVPSGDPDQSAYRQQQPDQDQRYQQQYQQPQYPPIQPIQPVLCRTCGGYGQGLGDRHVICKECKWLRPLAPGYSVDNSAFAWAADAKAMAALRAMKPLNAAAKAVSQKVGRRWIEVSFNGVLLGEKQMPQIYGQAVRAARLLGMSHMPDVYLSGERAWDCLTFGTDNDSFVVIGSALAGNFQGVDMLFLLAREMGHCKAGHALWKTVIRFFLGEQGPAKGFMAGGIFNAILSPTALVGGALEMPLLAWARQAEITADRAGLLTVGSEEVARRVLLSWSLRSSFIYRQLNLETWLEQQQEDDGDMLRLSELTTSSTPYLGPRLKLLSQFAQSSDFQHCLARIRETIARNAPPKPAPKATNKPDVLRIKCSECGTPMRVPMSALAGKTKLSIKCPSTSCGKITVIKKNQRSAGDSSTATRQTRKQENMNYGE